jgi:diaminopimelate epimerase
LIPLKELKYMYKNLRFIKANPSGNTTVFILNPLERKEYPAIAAAVMKDEVLCAQQVGFAEKAATPAAEARMQMMGGEFCGNASRSFAAWLALGGREYLRHGGEMTAPLGADKSRVNIEVSGMEHALSAEIRDIGCPCGCFAEISMPLPQYTLKGKDALLGNYTIVVFAGIIHIVLFAKEGDEKYFSAAQELLRKNGLSAECFGIIFTREEKGATYIEPLVYVAEVDSLIWEGSCGSGSVALTAAIAEREGKSLRHMEIKQPGGSLFVSMEWETGFKKAFLAGNVFITASGEAWVNV